MKKWIIVLIVLLLSGCSSDNIPVNLNEELPNDYVSSASIKYRYLTHYLKDEALAKAINDDLGIMVIGTCNKDNTINQAIMSFKIVENAFLISEISDSQTKLNLENNPQAMLVFTMYKADDKKLLNYQGAKIIVDYISDESKRKTFATNYSVTLSSSESLFKIVEIRPLG